MNKICGGVAAAVAFAFSSTASAEMVIDLFSTAQTRLTQEAIGSQYSIVTADVFPADNVIGGYREMGVEVFDNPLQNNAYIQVAGGYMSFNSGSGVAAQGLLRWDGSPNLQANANSPTDFNLGASFNISDQFELKTIKSDQDYKFTLEAYTDATHWSRLIIDASHVPLTMPNGISSYIPLIAFLDCTNAFPVPGVTPSCGSAGSVDWSDAGALQVILNAGGGTTDVDLTLNQVKAVPEPASLALAGIGLLGLAASRRRRAAK